MIKYCDYYITTQKHLKGEFSNSGRVYEYSWHIRNKAGEELESSFDNEDGFQLYNSRELAEHEATEAIQCHY